ncbi:MAG: hypothetical protein QOK16_4453 [Solirubrobacteraceae bacterium]|jgi:hypothetical protein|nr:hypothetical protein [Solirubrobacteraceae bacterium]
MRGGAETRLRDEIRAAPAAAHENTVGGELIGLDEPPAARALLARRRAAVRVVSEDLLRLADAGTSGAPRRPGDVAAAGLMELSHPNTREAYAAGLAAFFVWCAQRPINVGGRQALSPRE